MTILRISPSLKKNFLPAFLLVLAVLVTSPVAAAPDTPAETAPSGETATEAPADAPFETYSNVPGPGGLRLTGNITYSRFNEQNQFAWRGVFDYFLTRYWSFTGSMSFTLNKIDMTHRPYGSLGLLLHAFQIGDLDFFGGGAAGFTWVAHDVLPAKLTPTVEMIGGWTYYGSVFHLTGELIYKRTEYFARDTYIDMNELLISGGIGFHL